MKYPHPGNPVWAGNYNGASIFAATGRLTATILFCCAMLQTTPATEPNPAEHLLAKQRPLVIAHRGYSMLAPENTLLAFKMAVTAGADLVELDYYHSKDGVPIVFHDSTLDRTSDADEKWEERKIPVGSRSATELRQLDAGSWFSTNLTGLRIPLLTEALDVIQNGGVTLIERKAGDAKTCVELLRERNLINQLIVQAFDWNYLKDFHALAPEQVLGALGPPSSRNGKRLSSEEKILTPEWNDQVKGTGARLVVWNRQITPEAVEDAHKKGLEVWVYTINDSATATDLLNMGIDGIITDNPSIIWRALALRDRK